MSEDRERFARTWSLDVYPKFRPVLDALAWQVLAAMVVVAWTVAGFGVEFLVAGLFAAARGLEAAPVVAAWAALAFRSFVWPAMFVWMSMRWARLRLPILRVYMAWLVVELVLALLSVPLPGLRGDGALIYLGRALPYPLAGFAYAAGLGLVVLVARRLLARGAND